MVLEIKIHSLKTSHVHLQQSLPKIVAPHRQTCHWPLPRPTARRAAVPAPPVPLRFTAARHAVHPPAAKMLRAPACGIVLAVRCHSLTRKKTMRKAYSYHASPVHSRPCGLAKRVWVRPMDFPNLFISPTKVATGSPPPLRRL